jgi:hypothetical protein
VDELNHDEEAMAAEQVIVDTQENDRDQEDEIGESTTDEVTRRQEGGEQTLPVAETSRAGVDGSALDEMPATVAVERKQCELPDDETDVGENAELSLVQQPAELEEAVGEARMVKSREEEDMSVWGVDKVHHAFSFCPPKLIGSCQTRSSRRRRSGPSRQRGRACSWRSSTAAEVRVGHNSGLA